MTLATAESTEALWLATLQRVVGRAAHDVKDALNGVSVNLEVIRSRASRPSSPTGGVVQFAEGATHQLERLTSLLDALLALARPEREPVDVVLTLRRMAVVCGASASAADATVEVEDDGIGASGTRVRGEIVRLALAATLLEAVTATDRATPASPVTCAVRSNEDSVIVIIASAGRATVPAPVAECLRSAGVSWTEGEQDLSLAFPRA